MGQQLNFISKLNLIKESVVKANSNEILKLIKLDPKLSDLIMNRLKIF